MSSTHDALARFGTAMFLVAAMAGCKFDPVGLAGEPPVDGLTPVDGRPPADAPAPVDGQTRADGRAPIDSSVIPVDGPPVIDIDAMGPPQRRKQITIRAGQVQAPPSPGFLADFPVLFSVTDAQIAARASADGSDIYFVDAAGDRLDHEIEKWNSDTGELVAWVKIPSLSASADTVFHVYYGDPAQANPVNPADVWTSAFAAVWHLAERPGAADGFLDSTGDNHGTAHATMQASDRVLAQIGDGIDFDGVDDEITFQNPITGAGPHTISVWVNQRSTSTADALVVLGDGVMNRARWFYGAFPGNDNVAVGFYSNDWFTGANIVDDDWTLLHWTYESRDNVLYVDGVQVDGMRVEGGVDTQGGAGRLGNVTSGAFGADMNLNGQLDEVRIATVVRPAEWIRTEYNNQFSPSSFYTVGPETLP